MSKATTAAPAAVSRLSRSAMTVRGHGHWPIRASELLVDIDDPHRQVRIVGRRPELLVGVEGDQPQRLDEEGVGDPDQRSAAEDGDDQRDVEMLGTQEGKHRSTHPNSGGAQYRGRTPALQPGMRALWNRRGRAISAHAP